MSVEFTKDFEIQLRARRADFDFGPDSISLYLIQKAGSKRYAAEGIEIREITEVRPIKPFFEIDMHQAQKLMDDLWDCGLRPSEGTGSAGAMRAVQEHLSDLKKIAFQCLDQLLRTIDRLR